MPYSVALYPNQSHEYKERVNPFLILCVLDAAVLVPRASVHPPLPVDDTLQSISAPIESIPVPVTATMNRETIATSSLPQAHNHT